MTTYHLYFNGRSIAGWLMLGVLLALPAGAQGVEDKLAAAERRLEAARTAQLDLIAPRPFERAAERLEDARERFEAGGRIGAIERLIDQGLDALEDARQYEAFGQEVLREALAARTAAYNEGGPDRARRDWEAGEKALYEAGRAVEKGDRDDIRRHAGEAARYFDTAELNAIRSEVLSVVRPLRDEAREKEAERWASVTFREAERLLEQAEATLREARHERRDEARRLAAEAATQYQRASRITDLAQTIRRDPRTGVETLVRSGEEQLARIADRIGFVPAFPNGMQSAVDQILNALDGLYQDRDNLQQELAEQQRQLAQLQADVDALEEQLTQVQRRERSAVEELQARDRRAQLLDRAQTIFASDEAEVILGVDELTARLYGLTFESGSSEIRPENYLLLANLQRLLRMFPEASIVIAGHTDAQGNDDANQRLSEERATAVREYLLANMNLRPGRVQAAGYGETQPIAPNDTRQGRAKNRRIDVRVRLN